VIILEDAHLIMNKISRLIDNDNGNQIILSNDLEIIKEDLKKAWAKLAVVMRKI